MATKASWPPPASAGLHCPICLGSIASSGSWAHRSEWEEPGWKWGLRRWGESGESEFSSGNTPPHVGSKDLFHLWLLSESRHVHSRNCKVLDKCEVPRPHYPWNMRACRRMDVSRRARNTLRTSACPAGYFACQYLHENFKCMVALAPIL